MQLNLKTDFSLRLLLFLATHPEEIVPVGRVAEAFGISAHHLSKVARALAELGVIEMVRGRAGGVRLAMAPGEIQVGDIVRRIESDSTAPLVECFDGSNNTCVISPACALKGVLRKALNAFLAVLDGYSLADLTRNADALRRILDRHS